MTGPEHIDAASAAARLEALPELHEGDEIARQEIRRARRGDWNTTVPRRFRDARLDDLEGRAGHADLVAWSRADEPSNLVLLGPVGVGKTHAAVAAVRPHFGDGAGLLFVLVGEMLDRLDWRRADSHTYMDTLMSVDLLAVDDLGTERPNEWTAERLYTVVNRRWLDDLPTVATTNLEPDELTSVIGERTFSRLIGGALVLRLAGHDRRRAEDA